MNIVLSLFNGMSTLQQAMKNLNITYDKYYSSEIKPYAIKLNQYHFPDTIQLGDINNWKQWDIDWSKVDFIGSGSPCQDLSIAGKRAGIKGDRSSLFFTFVEILNHVKSLNPNVLFLQENVGSASREDVGVMSRCLGLYPCRLNSNKVTAQNRDRYYWTNIRTKQDGMFGDIVSDIPEPKDMGIMFKDIITSGIVERVKALALLESDHKQFVSNIEKQTILINKRIAKKKQIPNIIYIDKDKHCCLKSQGHRNNQGSQKALKHRNETTGMITLLQENELLRTVNKVEMCRLQGFPDDFCDILTTAQAGSLLGDGWTLPMIEHILTFIKN